jgi:hypothetical protein
VRNCRASGAGDRGKSHARSSGNAPPPRRRAAARPPRRASRARDTRAARRGRTQRIQHALRRSRAAQPRCEAAILVINPHQPVPPRVWAAWRAELRRAGLDSVPVVATHADAAALFPPVRRAAAAGAAQRRLQGLRFGESAWAPGKVRFVENYAEAPGAQAGSPHGPPRACDKGRRALVARLPRRRSSGVVQLVRGEGRGVSD